MTPRLLRTLALAALVLAAGGEAAAAGAEGTLPTDRQGVHVAGIGFFTAAYTGVLAEGEKRAVRLAFGDLESVRWDDGVLPVLDAQIVVANLTELRLVDVPVKVSLHFGLMVPADAPPVVAPGVPGIREEVFFERTFHVEEIRPLGLERIAVRDIQLAQAVEDYARQKIWPGYVRVEAAIEKLPAGIDLLTPSASAYLRIDP